MSGSVYARGAVLSAALLFCLAPVSLAQEVGGIRGIVYDKDFDRPLAGAQVSIVETGGKTTTTDEGNFVFPEVDPGTYTLVFSREGYTRQVVADVVVAAGRLTEVDASLAGEFVEMEEFIVQDLQLGGGSEIGLLNLRMESPSLMDSISSDLMSRAGVSDAASALRLVSGTTVEDGKYAVVRGLPDRYVNSQLNAVRLPTADADKRAVQLDQFPAALIESIRVSKTFTPDQQGDASGGAVNVVLKGIPEERVLKFSAGTEYNTQVRYRDDFLTYKGSDVMGTSRDDAPLNYTGSLTAGGKRELDNGVRVGALVSLYYKRDPSYYDGGKNDIYVGRLSGGNYTLVPYVNEEFTSLYDVTQGVDKIRWGALGAVGAEVDNHALSLLYMRTQVSEERATLLEDVRGNSFFADDEDVAARFHRSQTLEYLERSQSTVQLNGRHTLEVPELSFGRLGRSLNPEIDWTLAHSVAGMDSPNKRVFSSEWSPEQTRIIPGFPPITIPALYTGFDPSGTNQGFAQRIWKDITEDSDQIIVNGKLPFEQWSGEEGYLKVGLFDDSVHREYDQDSFSNADQSTYEADWSQFWTDVYAEPMVPSDQDVDYTGDQDISAWYYMVDMPLSSFMKIIGGIRYESTELEIENEPESNNAQYLPPDGTGWTRFGPEADVSYSQDDVLPALGIEVTPLEKIKIRASYSETVARQTFKELSPVMQMEYLGADIFVGNPELQMSALDNYDLRFDYEPYAGGLFSVSWFRKEVKDPIEYVQRFQASLYYITPINYPEGWLEGWELELRQQLGRFWSSLDGFAVGANATFIDSEVTLSAEEAAAFASRGVPTSSRDMMGAPEHLYNFNLTYESEKYGTKIGLFYTIRGDTLVEGGSALSNYVPDVYEEQFGTLNVGLSQPIGEHCTVTLQAKNLTDPEIRRVYRSEYISGDTVKTSYTKGIDISLSLAYEF
jgi:hypothetical protein